MSSKKRSPAHRHEQGYGKNKREYSTSASAQCKRLLNWLRGQPITTLQARKELDILAPAPRIYELRHNERFNIVTQWSEEVSELGVRHRVARYILYPGKFMEGK